MSLSHPESLDDILVIEREIGELVDLERSKAAKWLDETRRSIDEEAQSDTTRLKESAAQDQAKAEKVAQQRAANVVENAKAFAALIGAASDDLLRPIVWKHIASIAPKGRP